jgi:hypothetical protein
VEVKLIPCRRELWKHFAPYHYQSTPLNKSSRTFLATVGGKAIGFAASLPRPSGTLKNAFGGHKVAVRMEDCPAARQLWATISDAEAQLHVAEGKRFFSMAPTYLTAYRDAPNSGWKRTSKDKARRLKGYSSHEFVSGVIRVEGEIYRKHYLPEKHFRGKNPFGRCDYWAFMEGGDFLGFTVMRHDGKTTTLRRLVVDPLLPKRKHVAVGRALVRGMCDSYNSWTSTTDVEQEAAHYHDLYKVKGVTRGKPIGKEAPPQLKGIPLLIHDWQDKKKCASFLESNTDWHQRIVNNADKMGLGRFVRPAGRRLSLAHLQLKLQDVRHAARVLSRLCPTTQITYRWEKP